MNTLELITPELSESESQFSVPTASKAIVRLNQQDAKAFAMMLRRRLRGYEEENGPIPLPTGFTEAIDLSVDEW